MRLIFLSAVLASFVTASHAASEDDEESTPKLYTISGRVHPPSTHNSVPADPDWFWRTKVVVDGGKKSGFLREDGTFGVSGLPTGSYVVEVVNADYYYEPVRIDINSKGKMRARKVNNVQPTQVTQVPYPLKMKTMGRYSYFHKREEWKITDMLMNPMILMMVLPLLLITVLPKMMNDPETKKEMEQMQANMNMQNQMPEMSEIMANFFGGGGGGSSQQNKQNRQNRPNRPINRR